MYINFSNHKADKNVSSFDAFNYLDKENQLGNFSENFFSGDMNIQNLGDPNNNIDMLEAIKMIDENRGTQGLKSANFYMMNLSPSEHELEHLSELAEKELISRGFAPEKMQNDADALFYFNEQKEELIKAQLKLYMKDVMNKYAELMDREVYKFQDQLPGREERKEMRPIINALYQDFLKDKGIELYQNEEKEFVEIEYKESKSLENGGIFKISDANTGQTISLYLPHNKYALSESNKLLVDEGYFNDKYAEFMRKKELDNSLVSISELAGSITEAKSTFIDCENQDKIKVQYHWSQHDANLDLYFDKKDCDFNEGRYSIKQYDFEEKLQEYKISYLNKKFAEKRQEIFDSYAKSQSWDFAKIIDDKGKLVYKNPELVPSSEVQKKGNTVVSVDFNNWLVNEGHIEKRESFSIKDWNSTIEVNAVVLAESKKAKLLEIEDKRLPGTCQKWVGNFALKNENENQTKFEILKDVYEDILNKEILRNNSPLMQLSEYEELRVTKTKQVRGQESIAFKIYDQKIKENINLQILKEDLSVKEGAYCIGKIQFDAKYKNALYEHCKVKFEKNFEAISNEVTANLLGDKQTIINREIEAKFKFFLHKQGIEFERNDRYSLDAKILENKNNSSQLSYKSEKYENEVRFWVNNNSFEKEDGKLVFKNTEKIEALIDKAIDRDKSQKELVEVSFEKFEKQEKAIKGSEEKEGVILFYKQEPGFEKPVQFSIKEKDLVEKEGKYFTTKFNLNNKLEKAINTSVIKEYGNVKENIKHKIWEDFGYNTEKRKITGEDLLYFSKIEHERTYKFSDKNVKFNNTIFEEIAQTKNKSKISELEDKLIKDKHTGEVIKEGNKKGGLNYHIHTIVSRHDKTSVLTEDKVSMSPTANQKTGEMNNGGKVGFERTELFKASEKIFDQKFNYDRPEYQKFEYQNTLKNSAKGFYSGIAGQITEELKKHTGIKEIESAVNPIQNIKSQISAIPLPTSLPTSKIDAIKKLVKLVKRVTVDKGIEH
ncbi:hypothetical protein CMT22_17760 [Elizabethkingia anophelis]|nr:hypothetical protein [Elizabethkingia anophelis]